MNTVEIAAIGLHQDAERLRVLSHNVANISTPGYKRQIAIQGAFSDVVNSELTARSAMSTQLDVGAGKLRATGNPLDVAMSDREFLMVQTAEGSPALTRGGALHVDARGRLVISAGLAVQGTSGELAVPTTASDVRIDMNGQLFADDKLIGTLRVMKIGDKVLLAPLGEGLFGLQDTNDAQPVQLPRVQSGHTEASNVVSSQEMVSLMATMRHAESMARLIQGADEALEKTIRKLGEM